MDSGDNGRDKKKESADLLYCGVVNLSFYTVGSVVILISVYLGSI